MKRLCYTMLLMVISINVFCQNATHREQDGTRGYDYFKVKRDCSAELIDLNDPDNRIEYVILLRDTRVKFNEELENGSVIFESVETPFTEYKAGKKTINAGVKKYYKVSKKEFETKFIKIYSTSLCYGCFNDAIDDQWFNGTSVVIGVLTIPFKLRPESRGNSFEFNTGFSLGTTLSVRQRLSSTEPFYVGFIGYTGLSSVPLNSLNTKSFTSDTQPKNEAAFTYAGGVMLEFSKIQISFILGHDLISNQKNVKWAYHDRNWMSIGLGTYLFTKS